MCVCVWKEVCSGDAEVGWYSLYRFSGEDAYAAFYVNIKNRSGERTREVQVVGRSRKRWQVSNLV